MRKMHFCTRKPVKGSKTLKVLLELISIHIPKTAGRSFLDILNQEYGSNLVEHFNRKDFPKSEPEKEELFLQQLKPETKVIHGHFKYSHIRGIQQKTDAKVVVFLRDPVERVISNYFFFMKRIEENPDDTELQARKDESLLEYADRPDTQNRLYQWLEGAKIEDVFFIGFVEQYEKDVQALAEKLGWGNVKVPRVNDNRAFRNQLPKERWHERELIASWNHLDIALYNQARKARNLQTIS